MNKLNIIFALLLVPAIVVAEREVDETREMQPDGRVSFSAVTGEFEIIGTTDHQITISGTLGEDVQKMIVEGNDGHWTVELKAVERMRERPRSRSRSSLVIMVPESVELDANTISGDLVLTGLDGSRVHASSVSGEVRLSGVMPNQLQIKTVSGRVDLDSGGREQTRIQTVSGNVNADGLGGRIHARTVSGNIDLSARSVNNLDAETVSGHVQAGVDPLTNANLRLSSHAGWIRLALPKSSQVNVRASTFSGKIQSAFGGSVERDRGPGQRLEHRIGEGNVLVELKSFSGNIDLLHRNG